MKLTRQAAARSLDLPLSTLDRWVRQGRIPIHRHADGFEFKESVLRKWAATHDLLFRAPTKEIEAVQEAPLENLLPAMRRGGVFHGLQGGSAASALESAVALVPGFEADTRKELFTRLMERESLTSTGIGRGVAIPHPRSPLTETLEAPSITTCFLEKAVEFDAIDDQPVFVMFILLSTSIKVHLHLLSRLSFGVRSAAFVDFLRKAPDADTLYSRVAEFEARLDGENSL
jgi:PTS system nitrogen regulatory IIA component